MKKLLLILGLVILFSCEKDTYCWVCQQTTTYTTFYMQNEIIVSGFETCDKTLAEIQLMEKEQSYSITVRYGPDRYATTEKTLKCKVK